LVVNRPHPQPLSELSHRDASGMERGLEKALTDRGLKPYVQNGRATSPPGERRRACLTFFSSSPFKGISSRERS